MDLATQRQRGVEPNLRTVGYAKCYVSGCLYDCVGSNNTMFLTYLRHGCISAKKEKTCDLHHCIHKLYTCNPVGHAADKQTTHRDSALICPTPIVANVFFFCLSFAD